MFVQVRDGHADFAFVVAIEADAERFPASSPGRPAMLDQGDAEQMLAHLTADLGAVLSGIGKCHLVSCGVLFDQCQILRPGLPVFSALSELAGEHRPHRSTPNQTALGSISGTIPSDALTPDPGIPPTLLLLLPIVASGPEKLIEKLAGEMEHRFLAEGQVSAHTASWLEAAFGIGIKHGRFMTLTDLNAMFRMQLEHIGFLPLWELVDAAVCGQSRELSLTTANGTRLHWSQGTVQVSFQPFDYWANEGSGRRIESQGLGEAYAEWTRELRRYASTLAAHHIPVRFELAAGCEGSVGEHFLCEETDLPSSADPPASITEHTWPDLGIVAITIRTPATLKHFYPLTSGGLNDIHELIRSYELSGEGMAFPGRIAHDHSNRRLRPGRFDA
jgi:hypothetical protein